MWPAPESLGGSDDMKHVSFCVRAICAVLLMGFCVAGCRQMWLDQLPYGYLLDGRSAGDITEWTMQQTDPAKINNGIGALGFMVFDRRSQAANATAGLVAICRKIWDGWPGLVERPSTLYFHDRTVVVDSRRDVISYMRVYMRTSYHRSPKEYEEVMRQLHEIDPDIYEGDLTVVREKRAP